MSEEYKAVKKITVTYEDGSEEVIERGVVFSVVEKGETINVRVHGRAGAEKDEIAVLAIVARIAKEMGLDDLANQAEEVADE